MRKVQLLYAICILAFAVGCAPGEAQSPGPTSFKLAEGFNPVWHRGDVSKGQESGEKALRASLESEYPNVEVDAIYFEDGAGKQVGLISHDLTMERLTGKEGKFAGYNSIEILPLCTVNKELPPEKFITVIDFLNLFMDYKKRGIPALADLELKEDTNKGEIFGRWVGQQLVNYGLQKEVFVSSFFYSNMKGAKEACPDCLHGGNIYEDHWLLGRLPTSITVFDLFHPFSETKKINIINIQDKVLLKNPQIAEYWEKQRRVTFVAMFSSNPEKIYTDKELQIIVQHTRWGEFDPKQIEAYRKYRQKSAGKLKE